MHLYGHWRSLATYRVRVALKLKAIDAKIVAIDLLSKEHLGERYHAINPQGLLPALEIDDGTVLFQSMAIIEYLDEAFPDPPLLPIDLAGRAKVRGLAQIIAADAHPLMVPRVRDYLTENIGLDSYGVKKWIDRFALPAFEAIEIFLRTQEHSGKYCYCDTPGLADIFLASHVIGAGFFGCGLDPFPRIQKIYEACVGLEAFSSSHPLSQAGAPAHI
jgi:maleylacetoacetate isomerase